MAESPKRLGSTTTAATISNLVDNGTTAGTYTIFSSIVACNTDGATAFTVSLSTSNTTATHGTYIAKDVTVRAGDAVSFDKIVLDASSGARYLVVSASNNAVHVSAFGVQGP